MSFRNWFKGAKAKAFAVLGSFAMLLGLGASVYSVTAAQQNEVVETKAANTATREHTIWLAYSNCSWFSPYISYKNSSGTWTHKQAMTIVTANSLAKYNVPANTTTVIFSHTENWHSNNCQTADQDLYYSTPATSGACVNNKFTLGSQPGDSNQKIGGSWSYNTGLSNTLVFNKNNSSATGTMSNQTIWLDNATVNSNSFSLAGHTFDYWTTNSDGSGTKYYSGSSYTYSSFPSMADGTSVTLYAHWTINTYTITFHQNDGTGHTVTQSKTYGVTYTIPSLATLGMGASTGRCFLRWDTDEHGEGTAYTEGKTYTTNAALNLYMIQDWYKYEYSADGGSSWVAVDNLLETPTSGYIGELVTSTTHALTSGSSLTFRKYYGSGAHTDVSINAFFGNYGDGAIKFNYTGNVAVRVASNGNLDVFVDGYTERQIFVNSTPYGLYFSGNTDGYTNVPIALYPGDVIRGGFNGGSYTARLTPGDGDFSGGDGTAEVVCNAPGVFTIHLLSFDSGANFPNVSFDMDDSASATLFAQTFNTAIAAVCTGITGGTKTVSTDLVNAWGSSSSSGQYRYYNSLTSEAKALITTPTSDSDISACIAKYDYVCGKYGPNGTNNIKDFMGRKPAKPASAGIIPGSPNGTESPLTMTLWIVLASGIAGLGAIGTAYFVSKKKKRHQA